MIRYFFRRLLLLLPVLLVVAVVAFIITNIIPGDPVRLMMGDFATQEQILEMEQKLGFDQPVHVRFGNWLQNIIRGDLGESLFLQIPVTRAIISRLEPTIMLAMFGQLLGILIGIPLGVIAAVKHKTIADQSAIAISLAGISIPSFWLAIMLMLVFAVNLGWFPTSGYRPISEVGLGVIRYLVLPGFSLGFMQSALLARMTRSAMLDVLRQDYIRTARAKGLPEKTIIIRHALKNAMIPIITVLGFSMATLLGGTWIIETIYNIHGTGSLAINAILRRDYPVIQGSMIFVALIYVIVNLLVDLSYALINPRVRYR